MGCGLFRNKRVYLNKTGTCIFLFFLLLGTSGLSCSSRAEEERDLAGKAVFGTWRGEGPGALAVLERGTLKLFFEKGIYPRWSTTGRYIATSGDDKGLKILNSDGEFIKAIPIKAKDINRWDWLGTDEHLVVAEMTGSPDRDQHVYNLVKYNIRTDHRAQLTQLSRLNTITTVDVSPDGKKITFTRFWEDLPGPNMNIYLLDLDTMEEIEIDTRSSDPRFSQDGSKIVYDKLIVDDQGRPSIFGSHIMIYDVKTGEKKPIVDRPMSGKSFNLSRDGKTLIFSDDESLLKLDVPTGKVTRLLDRPLVKGSKRHYVKDRDPDWFVPESNL
jgi:Tol biopolymer transport system component